MNTIYAQTPAGGQGVGKISKSATAYTGFDSMSREIRSESDGAALGLLVLLLSASELPTRHQVRQGWILAEHWLAKYVTTRRLEVT